MKAGILLSGCGVKDGSEIHEAVLTMLCLDLAGIETICLAPDADQKHVVNHVTDQACSAEFRNMLTEAARIARGNITALSRITTSDIDALIFPGGFGAAKNLCTFAEDGAACTVRPDVESLILAMVAARKPLGALCIAPVLLARVLGANGMAVQVTVGNDTAVADAVNAMGARHVACTVGKAVIDQEYRVVTSPAYMLAAGINEVYKSAGALVDGIRKLCSL